MIITITGKPCSGKGAVSKILCERHNFEYVCTGNMMRDISKKLGFKSVLEFQLSEQVKSADKIVDGNIIEIGKTRLHENILIDSRLAWHFIPKSFKVFIDVDWNIAGERLLKANREHETSETLEEAVEILQQRWDVENKRYTSTYNTNNLDLSNYDFVVSSNNLSPEELAEVIYNEYLKFMHRA